MTADPILTVEGLEAWYGESQALFGVTLDLHEGETVTILGRNGAGKSTTLRSIVGLIRKRQGAIRLRGQDLMALPVHRVARTRIGYVPEERGIFASLSVEENLFLPPAVAEGGMSLEQIYEMFPNLYERRDSSGTQLSGGEQQMLAIARVLRTGANVLLLDEPTEGLAPVIVERIGKLLTRLKEMGHTILLVEQNFRFAARIADRFFVLENGAVVAELTRDEVAADPDALGTYLEV
ncbi:ABC transporter ATP-binding protein [Celeribacter indicus]|uniref:Amino acid ABC transporter ATP-binding protein n=1 Tax=Celeribacter indicus TaxID=1208324 RepID=A0A0B5E6U8_9RHOB|nr:ABC transporter ATP-binding protein [Celeribacter indicus]AJE49155.1 amino acid ABC transporter ATP-binding protein [Celeribacter indicus]SDX17731.1 amino acid/amide ABC transporter ATP-binding protein 2, HAAT family [Celeribacter indicus]